MVKRTAKIEGEASGAGPRYFTNVVAQTGSRLFSMAASMIVTMLCARRLGPDSFGLFSYAMAFVGTIGILAEAGTTLVLSRDLAARRHEPSAYFGNFILVRVAFGIFAALVGAAIAAGLGEATYDLLLLGAILAPIGVARFIEPIFQIFDRPWRSIPVAMVTTGTYLAASLAVLYLAPHPVSLLVAAYGLAGLAYIAVAFWMSRDLVRPRFVIDVPLLRGIMAMSLPLAVATIFGAVNGRIGTLLLAQLAPPSEVGQFAAAAKLVELGSILAMTAATPLLPILASASKRPGALRKSAQQLFELVAILALPALILLWLMAPQLVRLVFGAAFVEAGGIARILTFQLALIPFSMIGSAVMLATGEIRYGYWNAALAAAMNAILVLCLAPFIGARGVAIAAIASELSMLLVIGYHMRQEVGAVFLAGRWAKIALLNLGFLALVMFPVLAHPITNAVLALGVYLAIAVALGLLPRQHLATIFPRLASDHP